MKIGRNVPWVGGKSPFEFLANVFFCVCIPRSLCYCPGTEPVCLYTSEVKTPGLTGLHTNTL